jgi:hypothetical protein
MYNTDIVYVICRYTFDLIKFKSMYINIFELFRQDIEVQATAFIQPKRSLAAMDW